MIPQLFQVSSTTYPPIISPIQDLTLYILEEDENRSSSLDENQVTKFEFKDHQTGRER